MFCYIKDGELVTTSPQLIEKRQEEITENVTKTRQVEKKTIDGEWNEVVEMVDEEYTETVVVQPFVDGMTYDEVIETKVDGRVCYENGKIISWEKSAEKKREDEAQAIELAKQLEERKKNRPSEIIAELGRLKNERDWLALLWEDTSEVDLQISALKEEYKKL